MKLIKKVPPGGMIPAWYGVAWIQWDAEVAVCLPIPLNLLAAAVRALAIWLRHGYRAVPWNARDAYAQGLRDGKRSSHIRGRA